MASILETAASVGVFNTLLAAVDAAGLRGALEGPGPFTVFAPVDDAFAALPPGTSSWLKTTGTASKARRFRSAVKIPSR